MGRVRINDRDTPRSRTSPQRASPIAVIAAVRSMQTKQYLHLAGTTFAADACARGSDSRRWNLLPDCGDLG